MAMIELNDIDFRILVDKINTGIFVCDPKGTFVYANLALADIFGFGHYTKVIGRNFIEFISPDKGASFMEAFRKLMISGTDSTLIKTEIIRHAKETRHIEVKSRPFMKKDILLGSYGVLYDITERIEAEEKMRYTTTHDDLTGIFNRTFFEAEIKRLERGRQFPIGIVVIILGLSKMFHNAEDHAGEDQLIKRVARQLFYALRGDDILARIGEDEFAILFPSVDAGSLDEIIKRVQGNLKEINADKVEPAVEFYVGAATAKKGERLFPVFRKAEAMAYLEMKKKS